MKKKLLFIACLCLMAIGASAQGKFTVWYGANIATMSMEGGSPDSEFKFLNAGIDYTSAIDDQFDWTAGLSYQTKGCKEWDPSFIQLEANAGWNFYRSDDLKVGLIAGPSISLLVNKDDAEDTNSFGVGIQGGAKLVYDVFSLKVGYEYGFTDLFDGGKSKPNEIFIRLGYVF